MKENLHPPDVIFPCEMSYEKEIQKEEEEECLDENTEGLDKSVFFRPFFFQF
jgi:hypothetical protein